MMSGSSYTTPPIQLGAGGIQDSIKGTDYQLKLLQMFSLNAFNKNLEFECWTEDQNAEKFDDVIFKKEISNGTDIIVKFTFLQAKRKQKPKLLEFLTLFNDKNYDLFKYFDSFVKIENNYAINYTDVDIEELIICTNNNLPKTNVNGLVTLTDPTSGFSLHLEKVYNHEILEKCGLKYKFDATKQTENLNSFKNQFQSKPNPCSDTQILKFMEKFLLVTSLSETEIDQNIQTAISNKFNDPNELNFARLEFDVSIKNWMTHEITKPVEKTRIDEIFMRVEVKLCEPHFKGLKEKIFGESIPVFSTPNQELQDFLDSNDPNDKILIYQVSENEMFYGSIRIFQIDKSIIYLTSEYHDNDFKKAIRLLKCITEEVCFVVECTDKIDNFLKFRDDLEDEVGINSQVKLIIVCSSKNIRHFGGYPTVAESETLCGDLTDDSLEFYLEKEIDFQGYSTKLKDLIEVDDLKSVPLQEVENLPQLRGHLKKPEIYFPRTVYRRTFLKETLIEDSTKKRFQDVLCYSESDYKQNQKVSNSVHLVENVYSKIDNERFSLKANKKFNPNPIDKILWKKSFPSIETLRPYILEDEEIHINEDDFLTNKDQIVILKDIAGMGKSLFFQNLTNYLKALNQNCWIEKLDLQTFYNELTFFAQNNIVDGGNEEIEKFFFDQIMKFTTQIQRRIFKNLLNKGQVILILDGFDEVCENFQTAVIVIINILLKTSQYNKFFISTRPEWCEILEDEFLQFSYSLRPFSPSDQEEYLLKIWNKDSSWQHVAKLVLKNLENSITDKEKSFAGFPLITKLIGNYFEDKLDEKLKTDPVLQQNLLSLKFTLFDLLKHFIKKKFEVYCSERLKLNPNNPQAEMILSILKLMHLKLSFKILFPNEFHQLFESMEELDEKTIKNLVNCGLLEYENGQPKFHHQTTIECMVADHIEKNFNELNVLKFTFKVVLVGSGHRMIRSLINCFIQNITVTESAEILEFVPEALIVAAQESNTETFHFLFDLLDRNCESLEDLNQNLLSKDSKGFNTFFYYFARCDVSHAFLNKLGYKLGFKFIEQILEIENGNNKQRIMNEAALLGINQLVLVKWLIENFSDNFQVIKKIIHTKNHNGDSILHSSMQNFNKETFISLLDAIKDFEMKSLEVKLNREASFLDDLLLEKNSTNTTFIHCLFDNPPKNYNEDESLNDLLEILTWLKTNSKALEKLVLSVNDNQQSLIHLISAKYKKNLLKLLNFLKDSVKSKNFLKAVDINGDSFLSYVVSNDEKNEATQSLIAVLEWLKELDSDLLYEIIYSKNHRGKNFIQTCCLYSSNRYLPNLLITLTNWLHCNIPNFNHTELFRETDANGRSFLNQLLLNDEENEATGATIQILDWLKVFDPNFTNEIIYLKNNRGENLAHCACKYGQISGLPHYLKTLFDWLQTNIPNFDSKQFLKETDVFGDSILNILIQNAEEIGAITSIITILEWLKKLDSNLVNEVISLKNKYGRNLILCYCKANKTDNFPILLKTLMDWIQQNIADFNIKQFLKETDENGDSFFNLLVENDGVLEDYKLESQKIYPKCDNRFGVTSTIMNVFDWLIKFDSELLQEILVLKNKEGRNLIHRICEQGPKEDLSSLLYYLVNWIKIKVPDFNCSQLLREADKNGNSFLNLLILNDKKMETTKAVIEILEWLKKFDLDVFNDIIYWKNEREENLIHYYCKATKIEELPNVLKILVEWLQENAPNFNYREFLKETNEDGDSFLHVLFQKDFREANDVTVVKNILNSLYETDYYLLKEILALKNKKGRNLIHCFCQTGDTARTPIFLKTLTDWIQAYVWYFNCKTFLKETDVNGDSFLNVLVQNSKENEATQSIIDILDWLVKFDLYLLTDLIRLKNTFGQNLIHNFCKTGQFEELPKFLKTFISWVQTNIPNFNQSEFLKETDWYGDTFLNIFVQHNKSDKAVSILIHILELVKAFDSNLLLKIVFLKNIHGENLIHCYCKTGKTGNIVIFLKTLIDWLDANITDFDRSKFLKETDDIGNTFINHLVENHMDSKTTQSIIDILEWLKEFNPNLINEIIYSKNKDGWNLHRYCTVGRKAELPNFLKSLINWLVCVPDFNCNQYFREKDEFGNSFLNLVLMESCDNDAKTAFIAILEWLKEFDHQLLNDLIYWRNNDCQNLIHYCCQWDRKKELPIFIKDLTNWLSQNVPNFNRNKFLKEKDNIGNLFLSYMIINDSKNEATEAVIEILQWLKKLDEKLFQEIIESKNYKNRNLISVLCRYASIEDLPLLLKTLFEWLKLNVPNFNLMDHLLQKSNDNQIFLNEILLNNKESESSLAIQEILSMLFKLDHMTYKSVLQYIKKNEKLHFLMFGTSNNWSCRIS